MKLKSLTPGLIGLLAAGLLLCGCGSAEGTAEPEPTETAFAEVQPDPDALLKTIGTEQSGETVYRVKLKNETGRDIVGFSIRESNEATFPENMLPDGDVFAAGEERILYYDAAAAIEAARLAEENGDADAPAMEPAYDIELTLKAETEDGEDTVVVLHYFPFDDMESGTLCYEDEVAFVAYHAIFTDQDISTKAAEPKLREDEIAASQATSAAASSGGQSAPAQAPAASVSTPAPEPVPVVADPPAADPGSDSGCIGDEGLVY